MYVYISVSIQIHIHFYITVLFTYPLISTRFIVWLLYDIILYIAIHISFVWPHDSLIFFFLWEITKLFSMEAAPIIFPLKVQRSSLSLTASPTLVVSCLLDSSHFYIDERTHYCLFLIVSFWISNMSWWKSLYVLVGSVKKPVE